MQLVVQGSRFVARSSFDERAIPKSAGFRWDSASRVWYTEDRGIAARLAEYADEATAAKLDGAAAAPEPAPVAMRLGVDTDGAYRFWCAIDEKDICKAAGFRFENKAAGPRWITRDVAIAAKLIRYADKATQAKLKEVVAATTKALEMSRAADANVELPCPAGRSYLPFQKAGIAYGASRSGVLIGDDMGLGKTVQAAGLMNVDLAQLQSDTPYRALVICPASLRLNWRKELQRWLIREVPIHVIEGRAKSSAWGEVRAKGGIVVVNYDVVADHRSDIDTVEWDNLTIDEAHVLRAGNKTIRGAAILGGNDARLKERASKTKKGQNERGRSWAA